MNFMRQISVPLMIAVCLFVSSQVRAFNLDQVFCESCEPRVMTCEKWQYPDGRTSQRPSTGMFERLKGGLLRDKEFRERKMTYVGKWNSKGVGIYISENPEFRTTDIYLIHNVDGTDEVSIMHLTNYDDTKIKMNCFLGEAQ